MWVGEKGGGIRDERTSGEFTASHLSGLNSALTWSADGSTVTVQFRSNLIM